MVKLGFTGVYIIFLISAKNIDCGEAVLTSTHNLYFEQKYEKYQSFFLSENFQFLVVKFSVYLNRHVFVMVFFFSFDASENLYFAIVVSSGCLHLYLFD